ncbi:MAG: response regulator [Leptospiraceae bacterium]|nr:response regulator [Leptospiraceae bacterium]
MKEHSVLVVDDIPSIRTAIADYLSLHFDVMQAADGIDAWEVCQNRKVDFLLTDIRMPQMGGLELIELYRKAFPNRPFALMTAYDINDYIRYARELQIWNIIPKSTFLDLHFIHVMIRKLLNHRIFGIKEYFPECQVLPTSFAGMHRILKEEDFKPESGNLYRLSIETQEEKDRACDLATELLTRGGAPFLVRQILEELMSNAMVYGRLPEPGKNRVELEAGMVRNYCILSVRDFSGGLDRSEILKRLERQVTLDERGLPVGLSDQHGRGLFISRENLDHLIFNIQPGNCTEVIGMLLSDLEVRNRGVSIYSTDPDPS